MLFWPFESFWRSSLFIFIISRKTYTVSFLCLFQNNNLFNTTIFPFLFFVQTIYESKVALIQLVGIINE